MKVARLIASLMIVGTLLFWSGQASAALITGLDIRISEPDSVSVSGGTGYTTGTPVILGAGEFMAVTLTATAGYTFSEGTPLFRWATLLEPGLPDVSDYVAALVVPRVCTTFGCVGTSTLSVALLSDPFEVGLPTWVPPSFWSSTFGYQGAFEETGSLQLIANLIDGIGSVSVQSDATVPEAVPEPGTLFLVGAGLVGLGGVWKRRRRQT